MYDIKEIFKTYLKVIYSKSGNDEELESWFYNI